MFLAENYEFYDFDGKLRFSVLTENYVFPDLAEN